jgi:hypothetical protein
MSPSFTTLAVRATDDPNMVVVGRTLDGTEPSVSLTGAVGGGTTAVCLLLRGYKFSGDAATVASGSSLMPDPPSIFSVLTGLLIFGSTDELSGTAITAPTDFVMVGNTQTDNQVELTPTATMAAFNETIDMSGTFDPGAFIGGNDGNWHAVTLPIVKL